MATYYVSNSGSDTTGNGTELNPWATPRKAGEVLTTGDTLFIRGGTYDVDAWNHTTGQNFCQAAGTALAPILISAAIGSNGDFESVTFTGAIRREDTGNLFLPHYITWRGLYFPQGGFVVRGNSSGDRLNGWKIQHCVIRGGCDRSIVITDTSNVAGIRTNDAHLLTVEDCDIGFIDRVRSDNPAVHGGDGFKLYNTSSTIIQNCYIHDNYQQAAGDKQGGSDNVWRRNIIKDNPYGEHMRISTQPDSANGNLFNNNTEIYENIFISTAYAGSELFGVRLKVKTDSAKVHNNVFYGCGGIQTSADYNDATDPTEINTNAEIHSNIFMPTLHSSMKFVSCERWDANVPELLDFNCYYGSYSWIRNRNANVGLGQGDRASNTSSSLATWRTDNDARSRSDVDDNSINTDPLFVDPTSYTAAGFRLQAGSPCLGTGKDGLDMGCYPRRDDTVIGIRSFNPRNAPVRARSIKARGKGRFW